MDWIKNTKGSDLTKQEHRLVVEHPAETQGFIDSTREHGGASMFLRNKRLPDVGSENMYIVGREPSRKTGKTVDTVYENRGTNNRNLSVKQFASNFLRLKDEATFKSGNVKPEAMMGSWINPKEPEKGIQMDLSVGLKSRKRAEKKMIERNEDAIFDVKKADDIYHEDVRKKYTNTPRPPKGD